MRRLLPLALAGCAGPLPAEQPCVEVGYAIASRTAECEEDVELGTARHEAFDEAYVCVVPEGLEPAVAVGLYECSLVLRNLACELVIQYGDDLSAWIGSSDACPAILEPT